MTRASPAPTNGAMANTEPVLAAPIRRCASKYTRKLIPYPVSPHSRRPSALLASGQVSPSARPTVAVIATPMPAFARTTDAGESSASGRVSTLSKAHAATAPAIASDPKASGLSANPVPKTATDPATNMRPPATSTRAPMGSRAISQANRIVNTASRFSSREPCTAETRCSPTARSVGATAAPKIATSSNRGRCARVIFGARFACSHGFGNAPSAAPA